MTWDSSDWSMRFRRASAMGDGFRALRRQVFETTVEAVRVREYTIGPDVVPLDDRGQFEALRAGTVMYPQTDDLEVPAARRQRHETSVSVIEADCLEVARLMRALGLDPVVLNMASRRNPGGGVRWGAGAQEENLFRRSNLLFSLYQFADCAGDYDVPRSAEASYPIGRESGAIYSPGALVFRSSESTGYAFLRAPFTASFVTVPAISSPPTVQRDGALWLTDAIAEATRRKIRAILRVAARHDHDSAVLSALGCGAYENPPHHVARLFSQILSEPEFSGVFQALVFAIFNDHNAHRKHNPEGNLRPFQRVFDGWRA